jgi:hypothetical protein
MDANLFSSPGFVAHLLSTSQIIGTIKNVKFDVSDWTPIQSRIENFCYLKVFDFRYGSSASQQLVGASNHRASLNSDLDSLPPQEARFRVYIVEKSSVDDNVLHTHLCSRGFPADERPFDGADDTFEALTDQWKGSDAMRYESKMYSFVYAGHRYAERYGQIGKRLDFLAGLIKMNMSIQIRDVAGTDEKSISMLLA